MTGSDQITQTLLAEAMVNPPFTRFVMEYRPLRGMLARYGQLLAAPVAQAKSISALDAYEAGLAAAIDAVRPVPPKLGAGGAGSREEGMRWGRRREDGYSPGITRFWFRREVIGAAGLLSTWPTTVDGDLEPIDRDAEHPYLVEHEPVWKIAAVTGDSTPYALYTPLDLTSSDLDLVDRGELALQGVYDAREAAMLPILNAIVNETNTYFDDELPASLTAAIDSRRSRLRTFEAVTTAIAFPEEWKLPAPEVETVPMPKINGGDPQPTHLVLRDRLAPASFEDVQRTIRVWANAVERYPTAFNALEEDRISDVLAATLNASLPGADREVFSRRGKTDIQVRANAIEDGSSEAVIFITETKFATSKSVVIKALNPQLFSYLNAADTAAVLLLLFRQKNRKTAYATYLPLLKQIEGFEGESDSAVAGWKINRYKRHGQELRLLVATVHIPPV